MISIKVIKSSLNARVPYRGSRQAAGHDLYSIEGGVLMPGDSRSFNTGLRFIIPPGFFGQIVTRSGLGFRHGIEVGGGGIIDSDYRGNVYIKLYNQSDSPYTVAANERIAQLLIHPVLEVKMEEMSLEAADELLPTERGSQGFGSSGKY